MNYFERRIETCARRIKRIGETPDPTKLKSNKLMYEVELETAEWLNEAWKAGKPFVYASESALMRAMGLINIGPRGQADGAGPEIAQKCLDLIRREGYPENCCDRAVMAAVLAYLGDFPTPSFIVASNRPCDHAGSAYKALAGHFNFPIFPITVSFRNDEEALRVMTDDLGNMVEFAESRVPGAKFDEDRLIEYLEKDREQETYLKQCWEFLSHVPSPIDPREGFREYFLASNQASPDHCIEWSKARRDELGEKAEKGFGAMANEKLRCIWLVTGYNNDRVPFDYLESRGVAVLMRPDDGADMYVNPYEYGDTTQFGRKLSPLEEVARKTVNASWCGLGFRWVNTVVYLAKELKCDFVINFIQSGCVPTLGLNKLIEEALEREGIPSLRMEGRGLFLEGYNRDEVIAEFRDYIDMMLERKGLAA